MKRKRLWKCHKYLQIFRVNTAFHNTHNETYITQVPSKEKK